MKPTWEGLNKKIPNLRLPNLKVVSIFDRYTNHRP